MNTETKASAFYLPLLEMVRSARVRIAENMDLIVFCLQVALPVVLASVGLYLPYLVLFSFLWQVFCTYIKKVANRLNQSTEDGVPIARKRYVKIDKYGFLQLEDQDDLPEIIQYLYEIEQYTQRQGKVRRR